MELKRTKYIYNDKKDGSQRIGYDYTLVDGGHKIKIKNAIDKDWYRLNEFVTTFEDKSIEGGE